MKKTYINPEINVVKVELNQLMVQSQMAIGGETDTFDSRYDGSDWDDED